MIVENRVGAGGQIALTELAGAEPDGHTIGLTNLPSLLAYVNLDKQATYDGDSFIPLAGINRFRGVKVVADGSKYADAESFISAAKAAPGQLTVGVDGLTGDDHIIALQFEEQTGTDLKVVPFDSGSEKLTALIGGQIDVSFGSVPTFKAQLDTGEIRALAALDEERIPGLRGCADLEGGGLRRGVGVAQRRLRAGRTSRRWRRASRTRSPTRRRLRQGRRLRAAEMEAGGYVFGFQDSKWAADLWAIETCWEEFAQGSRRAELSAP